MGTEGKRLFSPSAGRNRDAIREVFLEHGPKAGRVLEIGSGTGEHGVHIASQCPTLQWWPGDPDPEARASVNAWIDHSGLANLVSPAHEIDVTQPDWTKDAAGPFDGVVSINMIHIAPFEAAQGLFRGAGELLTKAGVLFLYGPFSRNGTHTAASNERFHSTLKRRDARWGVRDLERDLLPLASAAHLSLERIVAMPKNNFCVLFTKQAGIG